MININPGIRRGTKQPYTIMTVRHIYFLTHDISTDQLSWNMFMDDAEKAKKIEKLLRNYLTNR